MMATTLRSVLVTKKSGCLMIVCVCYVCYAREERIDPSDSSFPQWFSHKENFTDYVLSINNQQMWERRRATISELLLTPDLGSILQTFSHDSPPGWPVSGVPRRLPRAANRKYQLITGIPSARRHPGAKRGHPNTPRAFEGRDKFRKVIYYFE